MEECRVEADIFTLVPSTQQGAAPSEKENAAHPPTFLFEMQRVGTVGPVLLPVPDRHKYDYQHPEQGEEADDPATVPGVCRASLLQR